MKSLFPEIEDAIRDDRRAARRENVQRAREYIGKRNISWLINYLLEHGPTTEHMLIVESMSHADDPVQGGRVLFDIHALWLIRKLWRRSVGIHPGSGEESFIYGIRGVHNRMETK